MPSSCVCTIRPHINQDLPASCFHSRSAASPQGSQLELLLLEGVGQVQVERTDRQASLLFITASLKLMMASTARYK